VEAGTAGPALRFRNGGRELESGQENAMRAKRVGQTALTAFLFAACMMLFMASYAAIAPAQNLSSSLTLP